MKSLFKSLTSFVFLCLIATLFTHSVFATKYDLIAPTTTLQRGQEVKFTVTIDTEGASLSNAQIGMTYKSDVLQYVNVIPGNTFTNISITPDANNNLIISGTSSSPFTGTGDFAYVTFKIIATSPGSTDLCVLFAPTVTSTPGPTSVQPTALPVTGETTNGTRGVLLAIGFFTLTGVLFVINQKNAHVKKPVHQAKVKTHHPSKGGI